MGINLMTALIIQGNGQDIKCSFGGPAKDNGKYCGWISLWKDGDLHTELLSTEAIFDTAMAATAYMEKLVVKVRSLDLIDPLQKL